MQFQLDEHVSHAVAHGLSREQIVAYTSTEAGMRGMADPDVLAWCNANARILVTHDRHFLEFHHDGAPHAGIAFCRAGTRSIGEMIESLVAIAEAFTDNEMV